MFIGFLISDLNKPHRLCVEFTPKNIATEKLLFVSQGFGKVYFMGFLNCDILESFQANRVRLSDIYVSTERSFDYQSEKIGHKPIVWHMCL